MGLRNQLVKFWRVRVCVTHSRNNSGHQTSPTAENGKDTHNQLGNRETDGNHIHGEHELGHLAVRVQAIFQLFRKDLLRGFVEIIELPDLEGVEIEVCLARRAVLDLLLALVIDIALAVVPQPDLVEVLQVLVGRAALECC